MSKQKYRIRIIEALNSFFFICAFLLFASVLGGYECNNYGFVGFLIRLLIDGTALFVLHEIIQHVVVKLGTR